jgi:DNA-binding SARP family transcriptional activator
MLEYRILGPLGVSRDGVELEVQGLRERKVLARLLLSANRAVSIDDLIELWRDPPASVRQSLQNAIRSLRDVLGTAEIDSHPAGGYRIRVGEGMLDFDRFQLLLRRSRSEEAPARVVTLGEARELWRGDPLEDMRYEEFAQEWIRHADELRIVALQAWLEALNARGRYDEVVPAATAHLEREPTNESVCHELILALYHSGRQTKAMETYHALLRARGEATGQVQPGVKLSRLYDRILAHDVDVPARPRESRVDRSSEIHRALKAAQLVPVLGPRSVGAEPGPAPDPMAIARHLAQTFDCPPEVCGSLPRVAQYVRIKHGVGPLDDAVSTLFADVFTPSSTHRALAALAPLLRAHGLPCQLILASGYDRMLERAFLEAGEEVDVVSYIAHGRDRGKFLHIAPDGAARIIHEPNLEVGLKPDERTVILKLHGGVAEVAGRDGDGYVVSEDDYIDYLARSEPSALLPIGLTKLLRRSHLLFLGYELEEWSLRVFLLRLWGDEGLAWHSWVLDSAPSADAREHWRPFNVDVIDISADAMLGQLHTRLAADVAPRAEERSDASRTSSQLLDSGDEQADPDPDRPPEGVA